MSEKVIALAFLDELNNIHNDGTQTIDAKYQQLRSLLDKICKDLTQNEPVQFSGLFSRLSFVCHKYNMSGSIQDLRVTANKVLRENFKPTSAVYNYHISLLGHLLCATYRVELPEQLLSAEKPSNDQTSTKRTKLKEVKVCVLEKTDKQLVCQMDLSSISHIEHSWKSDQLVSVQILETKVNDLLTSAKSFWVGAVVYLIDVEIDNETVFYPKILVLEPDYLLDVSAIAECLQDYGHTELLYLKSKFEAISNSKPILLGNYANLVVDELFSNKEKAGDFNSTFIKHFKANSLEYTTCRDIDAPADFRAYHEDSRRHYEKIKQLIEKDFSTLDIDLENISLEPSFLSEKYGIQGRMDMLDWRKDGHVSKIIELKSGRPPFPDDGEGVKENHQAQLFMYYLLYSQAENLHINQLNRAVQGYIMYSKPERNNLRGIGVYIQEFQKIIDLRNRIIIIEHLLIKDLEQVTKHLLSMINPQTIINKSVHPNFRRLLEPQLESFLKPIASSSELEQTYFISFVNYIAYEHFLSKVGSSDIEKENQQRGLARLWLDSFEEKKEKFEILYDLLITKNQIHEDKQTIVFERSNAENRNANFRVGDICLLYPRNEQTDRVSNSQVFKCTIKEITRETVVVYFRYKQRNTAYFDGFGKHAKWALEADFMDSSYHAMYRNMYSFLGSKQIYKDLILTSKKPTASQNYIYKNPDLSFQQRQIISKALSANHYFLLNGPPGTGKTSIIIKNLVAELIAAKKSMLLLAYTNRAVDELCEAISCAIGGKSKDNFVRFGSKLSCSVEYQDNLLDSIMESKEKELLSLGRRFTRAEVKEALSNYQVYVSTVASISSKEHIFAFKDFDYIIVDEASQILEPHLVGLLARADRFILIGDHKQLPAISLQSTDRSKTNNPSLEKIGLYNRKNSLFERLYNFCEQNNLTEAYDTLTYQGRMHKDIALFPNFAFYGGTLFEAYDTAELRPDVKLSLRRQVDELSFDEPSENTLRKLLSEKRMIFFNNREVDGIYTKHNAHEADLVVRLIQDILVLYKQHNKAFDPRKTLGVIAPFRNQIALIKQKLEEAEVPFYDEITVDSVERFQGSQRDIIIYSFSINNPYQLQGMINLNDDGDIDRKLNVALTRAREQMILIGNDSLLSSNMVYLRLIEHYRSKGGYIDMSIADILGNKPIYYPRQLMDCYDGVEVSIDEVFQAAFDDKVEQIIRSDRRTIGHEIVLGLKTDFARNNLIRYGMADFDQQVQLNHNQNIAGVFDLNSLLIYFTPKENVLLYCYWNMRKHFIAAQYVYKNYRQFLLSTFEDNAVCFVDFACGPLTGALAFNSALRTEMSTKVHYIGVDCSKAMLEKAREFSLSDAFNKNDTFDFSTSLSDEILEQYQSSKELSSTIIFNFTYALSALNIEQLYELGETIGSFIVKYPNNRYLLFYQNSVGRDQNLRKLLEKATALNKVLAVNSAQVHCKNDQQDWYATNEHFNYEVLSS